MNDWNIIAHRGGSINQNENSKEAFDSSYKKLIDANENVMFETDIRMTKDKSLILFHDDNLKRLFNIEAKIKDHTFDEIQIMVNNWISKNNFSSKITLITFSDLFIKYPRLQRVYVDIKDKDELGFESAKIISNHIIENKLTEHVVITTENDLNKKQVTDISTEIMVGSTKSETTKVLKNIIFKNKSAPLNNSTTIDLPYYFKKAGLKFKLFKSRIVNNLYYNKLQISFWDGKNGKADNQKYLFASNNKVFGLMVDDVTSALSFKKRYFLSNKEKYSFVEKTIKDSLEIKVIVDALFPPREAWSASYIRDSFMTLGMKIYLLMDGEKIIGITGLTFKDANATAWFAINAVFPKYRRKGFSTFMYKEMIEKIKKLGFDKVYLWVTKNNVPATSMYTNLGFIYTTEETSDSNRCVMTKKLH